MERLAQLREVLGEPAAGEAAGRIDEMRRGEVGAAVAGEYRAGIPREGGADDGGLA